MQVAGHLDLSWKDDCYGTGTFPGISSVCGKTSVTPYWRNQPPLIRRVPITVICFSCYPSSSWAAPRGTKHAKSDLPD